jgi:hypothetical protein
MSLRLRPFVVFALPRSRTAWLSMFLTYGGIRSVGHDSVMLCNRIKDFPALFGPGGLHGTVETGAVMGWRLLRQQMPEAKFVILQRDLSEVRASLEASGIPVTPELDAELRLREAMLMQLSHQPGVWILQSSDLGSPAGAAAIFEHCLELDFDPAWWIRLNGLNIQLDLEQRFAQLEAASSRIAALKAEVAAASATLPPLGAGMARH